MPLIPRAVQESSRQGITRTLQIGSIAASGTAYKDLFELKPAWRDYLPFTGITINNGGGTNITVKINNNDEQAYLILAGVIKTLSEDIAIRSVSIVNESATTATTANAITLDFEKNTATPENIAKKIGGWLGI